MSELFEFVKEFLVGRETPPPEVDQAALDRAVDKYERRLGALRILGWFQVTLMSALMFSGVVWLARMDDAASARDVGIAVAMIVGGGSAVAFGKLTILMSQYEIAVGQELKRVQIRILDLADLRDDG